MKRNAYARRESSSAPRGFPRPADARATVPAKAVNDAIARDTEQPGACLLKGFGKPIGLDEFFKHIL